MLTSLPSTTNPVPSTASFLGLTLPMALVHMTFFVIPMPQATMGPAVLSTGTVEILTLTVELGARADVRAPQVVPVGLRLGHTHLMANAERAMATSSVTPTALFTRGLAVPLTDGVVTPLITVGLAAKADVMAQVVVLGVTLGAALGQQIHHQRHLAPKNLYSAHLRVRRRMAATQPMEPAAQVTGTLFAVTGQKVVVVLFTG